MKRMLFTVTLLLGTRLTAQVTETARSIVSGKCHNVYAMGNNVLVHHQTGLEKTYDQLSLYDSSLQLIKTIIPGEMPGWNSFVLMDENTVYILYHPNYSNTMVASGKCRLLTYNALLDQTGECTFSIPASHPNITSLQRVNATEVLVIGELYVRYKMFCYKVNTVSGKMSPHKVPYREPDYACEKHEFKEDNRVLNICEVDNVHDSVQLNISNVQGKTIKKLWVGYNRGYWIDKINVLRIGPEKYVLYTSLWNLNTAMGTRYSIFMAVVHKGNIVKKINVPLSTFNLEARNNFSMLEPITNPELLKNEKISREKELKRSSSLSIKPMDMKLEKKGNYFLTGGIGFTNHRGGMMLEFDTAFNLIRDTIFPVAGMPDPNRNQEAPMVSSTWNENKFTYLYKRNLELAGAVLDVNLNIKPFVFDIGNVRTAEKNWNLVWWNSTTLLVYYDELANSDENSVGYNMVLRKLVIR